MHATLRPARRAAGDRLPALSPATILLALSTLLALVPGSASAQVGGGPAIVLSDGYTTITSQQIGNSLFAGLAGAQPFTLYQLELRDEAQQVVASATVRTDRRGNARPVLLWLRSGVVGCDPDATPDPATYQFIDFELAEMILDGRTFTVAAVAATAGDVAATDLPLAVRTTPLIYPSDGVGCPRFNLAETEDLYVTVHDVPAAASYQSMRLWVVAAPAPSQAGDLLDDLRPEFHDGQVEKLEPKEPISVDPDLPPAGNYCTVAQLYFVADPPLEPNLREEDLVPGRIQCFSVIGVPAEPW